MKNRFHRCAVQVAGALFALCALVAPARAQAPQLEKSTLWEISGKGLAKPSYLFGTIHVICPEDYHFSDRATAVFEGVEQVFLEMDMDDPNTMAAIQRGMMMPGGASLQTLLDEKQYAALGKFFKDSVGMDIAMLGRIKPMLLASMLFPKLMNCPLKSYEMEIIQMATAQRKEVLGLETAQDQLAAIDQLPLKEQAENLAETVTDYQKSKQRLAQLVQRYKDQDVAGLYQLMTEDANGPAFEKALLETRNKNWIPRIADEASKKSTFFAVGAGHLGGPQGVIALLRAQGYTVTPLK